MTVTEATGRGCLGVAGVEAVSCGGSALVETLGGGVRPGGDPVETVDGGAGLGSDMQRR
jgi:hypothetical protein